MQKDKELRNIKI